MVNPIKTIQDEFLISPDLKKSNVRCFKKKDSENCRLHHFGYLNFWS